MAEGKKKNPLVMWVIVFGAVAVLALAACAGAGVTLYYVLGPERFSFARAPGSADALEKQLQGAFADLKSGDKTKVKAMLVLPEAWFSKSFGDAKGKELHKKYVAKAAEIENRLVSDMQSANTRKLRKIEVDVFAEKGVPMFFKKVLESMTEKPPLLQAYLTNPDGNADDGMVLGPFVLVDGSFRFFSADLVWTSP